MRGAQIIHGLIALVSLYTFFVFAVWWAKERKATSIYSLTCFLMLGLALTHGGVWFVYWQLKYGDLCGLRLILSYWWWDYRNLPLAITLTVYAVHITCRITKGRYYKNYGRRRTDV